MSLTLGNIKKGKGIRGKRKRVGRGNSAGQGTYCGRGLKGQKSRTGVSNLKRLGMKQMLLRTPKKKGFTSQKAKDQIVNISELNKHFKDNSLINPKELLKKGLVDNVDVGIKLLGNGELKIKGLKVEGLKISAGAKEKIEKTKGKINL